MMYKECSQVTLTKRLFLLFPLILEGCLKHIVVTIYAQDLQSKICKLAGDNEHKALL